MYTVYNIKYNNIPISVSFLHIKNYINLKKIHIKRRSSSDQVSEKNKINRNIFTEYTSIVRPISNGH